MASAVGCRKLTISNSSNAIFNYTSNIVYKSILEAFAQISEGHIWS
jgi:hypothetical protein